LKKSLALNMDSLQEEEKRVPGEMTAADKEKMYELYSANASSARRRDPAAK